MKVFLDTVGCRLNQAEVERTAQQLMVAGHELECRAEASELIVLNTCAVTAAAAAESRSRSRRFHRMNPSARIILTGCWSTLQPDQAASLPGVSEVIPNKTKDDFVRSALDLPEDFDLEPVERVPIPGVRRRTRAFVKVQDGCSYACAFCITTVARGLSRSIPAERVVAEIRAAAAGDVKEVVLTGVALSSYGRDLNPAVNLTGLVRTILEETDIPRLRLSSLEPWGLSDDFFSLWGNPSLCRQLHLPLQSGCTATLARMNRPIDPQAYARLVEQARAGIPDLAVTTDLIVGFPGETDEEFRESLEFVQSMQFAGAHIFTYSPREGTPAVNHPHPVHGSVARERFIQLNAVCQRSRRRFMDSMVGKRLSILVESGHGLSGEGWQLSGLSDNYLRVRFCADQPDMNVIRDVRLVSSSGKSLLGVLIEELA